MGARVVSWLHGFRLGIEFALAVALPVRAGTTSILQIQRTVSEIPGLLCDESWMLLLQPPAHIGLQLVAESDQLFRFRLRRSAGVVVLDRIPFLPAALEIVGLALTFFTENVRQRTERARMRHGTFGGPVTFGVEQNRAQLQRRVVSDAILPVGRNATGGGVLKVPLDDLPEVADLLGACRVRLEPPGRQPGR